MTTVEAPARNRLLAVLFVGVLMGALDIAIVGPALPAIREAFRVDERATAWVFTIFVLFYLVGTPLMAKLSDRLGRRWVYLADVALFGIGSIVVAFAPSFTVLLGGRAIQAIGAGGIFPVAAAVIGDTFPPERRGQALGLIGAVFGIAFLVGPILGGILLVFGWPLLFLVNVPIAVGLMVAAARIVPATRPPAGGPFDWTGLIVLSVLLSSLTIGISQLDTERLRASFAQPLVGPLLLTAIALTPVFIAIERRAADPILRVGLFRSRQVALVATFAVVGGLGEAVMVFLPALSVANFGVSPATSSFMLLPVVIGLGIGSPIFGRLLDQIGPRLVLLNGLILTAAGMLLIGLLSASLPLFLGIGALIGLGLSSLLGAPLRYVLLNEVAARDRGSSQGVLTVFTGIGQLAGGAFVAAISASQGGGASGYRLAFASVGLIVAFLATLALGIQGEGRKAKGESGD